MGTGVPALRSESSADPRAPLLALRSCASHHRPPTGRPRSGCWRLALTPPPASRAHERRPPGPPPSLSSGPNIASENAAARPQPFCTASWCVVSRAATASAHDRAAGVRVSFNKSATLSASSARNATSLSCAPPPTPASRSNRLHCAFTSPGAKRCHDPGSRTSARKPPCASAGTRLLTLPEGRRRTFTGQHFNLLVLVLVRVRLRLDPTSLRDERLLRDVVGRQMRKQPVQLPRNEGTRRHNAH
ncbi:hypothetical protein DIPPA_11727 [Diplonema papillatum]|nr:hypothetical protein DIPPA_11727 [Diplonema papillatum]